MSTTAPSMPTEPMAVPRALGGRRVRRGHLALAVVLIAAGGVLAAMAFVAATNTGSYLAVTRRVPAGATVREADLRVVQLNEAPGVTAVPASDRARMVGQRATVTLLPGQVLVRESVTKMKVLQRGQRQVGVKLEPGQMPADRLYSGDAVLVIQTPSKTTATAASAPPTGATLGQWDATVVGSDAPSPTDESAVVYLAVDNAAVADIAALASAGQLVVALAGSR